MILSWWLLKRLATNVLFVSLGLAALLTVFDSLAHGGEVAAGAENPLLPMLYYALLRFPAILLFLVPFSVLIAALITFGSLSAQWEIVALEATGFTLNRISVIFAFAATGLGVLAFWVGDRVLPPAFESLEEWEQRGYSGLPGLDLAPKQPEWLASESYIARLSGVSGDGAILESPTLLRLNDDGVMTLYLRAQRAVYQSEGWELQQVAENVLGTGNSRDRTTRAVRLDLKPHTITWLNVSVEALRFSQLRLLGSGRVETPKESPQYYRMAAYRRIAQPLAAVVLLLFAVPAARWSRVGSRMLVSVLVMAAGFLYFVVERLCLAMGEVGNLPVVLAAFGPHLLFACFAILVLVHKQQ
jgi:lipopolysaccharide export system permease protein